MNLLKKILEESKKIDAQFEKTSEKELNSLEIILPVPKFHPRFFEIEKYKFAQLKLEDLESQDTFTLTKDKVIIIDESVSKQKFVDSFVKKYKINPIILKSVEDKVKTKKFLDNLLKEHKLNNLEDSVIIVIGGGLLINIGAYLAERTSAKLILFPTTVLSMADSAGGKVRVNYINETRAYKHFYKSFYEPNAMFLDERFLDLLPEKQIQIGLVEIIKHGLFQSPKLYDFLFKEGKNLFKDKQKLKKAILWATSLKKVCLEIDVEENENGSRRILRGGHDFSDRIEEDERLRAYPQRQLPQVINPQAKCNNAR
ncbi:MAG: hypothetical protein KKD18_00370 [Nanoarchaeota archaeon]|nr:hypothetical protein [Nanoarchaeota archaeon]MBU0976853.1 hypothetical protein [Nanoarchaeota archaeon]